MWTEEIEKKLTAYYKAYLEKGNGVVTLLGWKTISTSLSEEVGYLFSISDCRSKVLSNVNEMNLIISSDSFDDEAVTQADSNEEIEVTAVENEKSAGLVITYDFDERKIEEITIQENKEFQQLLTEYPLIIPNRSNYYDETCDSNGVVVRFDDDIFETRNERTFLMDEDEDEDDDESDVNRSNRRTKIPWTNEMDHYLATLRYETPDDDGEKWNDIAKEMNGDFPFLNFTSRNCNERYRSLQKKHYCPLTGRFVVSKNNKGILRKNKSHRLHVWSKELQRKFVQFFASPSNTASSTFLPIVAGKSSQYKKKRKLPSPSSITTVSFSDDDKDNQEILLPKKKPRKSTICGNSAAFSSSPSLLVPSSLSSSDAVQQLNAFYSSVDILAGLRVSNSNMVADSEQTDDKPLCSTVKKAENNRRTLRSPTGRTYYTSTSAYWTVEMEYFLLLIDKQFRNSTGRILCSVDFWKVVARLLKEEFSMDFAVQQCDWRLQKIKAEYGEEITESKGRKALAVQWNQTHFHKLYKAFQRDHISSQQKQQLMERCNECLKNYPFNAVMMETKEILDCASTTSRSTNVRSESTRRVSSSCSEDDVDNEFSGVNGVTSTSSASGSFDSSIASDKSSLTCSFPWTADKEAYLILLYENFLSNYRFLPPGGWNEIARVMNEQFALSLSFTDYKNHFRRLKDRIVKSSMEAVASLFSSFSAQCLSSSELLALQDSFSRLESNFKEMKEPQLTSSPSSGIDLTPVVKEYLDSSVNTAKSAIDDSSLWTAEIEYYLILFHCQLKGRQRRMSSSSWISVLEGIKKHFNIEFTKTQCQEKFSLLKKQLCDLSYASEVTAEEFLIRGDSERTRAEMSWTYEMEMKLAEVYYEKYLKGKEIII
jgi:hypothetical protein